MQPNNQISNQQPQQPPQQQMPPQQPMSQPPYNASPSGGPSPNKRTLQWIIIAAVAVVLLGLSVFAYLRMFGEASAEDLRQAILGNGAVTCTSTSARTNSTRGDRVDLMHVRDGDIYEVSDYGSEFENYILTLDKTDQYRWDKDVDTGRKDKISARLLDTFEFAEDEERFIESIDAALAEEGDRTMSCIKGAKRSLFNPPRDVNFRDGAELDAELDLYFDEDLRDEYED
ncbi:MAG: hypothetical protein WDZ42_00120 [Candidatus Saccharimonadales bacterium]